MALDALRTAASRANSRRERTAYALHLRLERQCVTALRHWFAQTTEALAKQRAADAEAGGCPTEEATDDIWGLRLGALLLERLSTDHCGRYPTEEPDELLPAQPPAGPHGTEETLDAAVVLQARWRGRCARLERRSREEIRTEHVLARAAAEAEADAAASAATAAHAAAALQVRMRRNAHRSHANLAAAALAAEGGWLEDGDADYASPDAVAAWDRMLTQRLLARGWRRWRAAQVVRRARLLRLRAAGDIASKRRRRAGLAALLVHSLNTIVERQRRHADEAEAKAREPSPPPNAEQSVSLSQFAC